MASNHPATCSSQKPSQEFVQSAPRLRPECDSNEAILLGCEIFCCNNISYNKQVKGKGSICSVKVIVWSKQSNNTLRFSLPNMAQNTMIQKTEHFIHWLNSKVSKQLLFSEILGITSIPPY
jgi:hypothetical protein